MSHSSQSGFERSRRWEKMRPDELAQLLLAARAGQRGVAHVVVEVEARVVDPEGPAHLEARERRASGGSAAPAAAATRCARRSSSRAGGGPSKITSAPTCMCDACFSWCRKEASMALRRSLWPCVPRALSLPVTIASVKLLGIVLAVQVLLGLALVALVATDNLPFTATARRTAPRAAGARATSTASTAQAAYDLLRRPGRARSAARRLGGVARARGAPEAPGAERPLPAGARRAAQRGRHRAAAASPATWSSAPTTTPRTSPASWARTTAPRAPPSWPSSRARSGGPRHTIRFVFFDGEESPRGRAGRAEFEERGLRGSKVAARRVRRRPGDDPARLRGRARLLDPARGLLERGAVARAACRRSAGRRRAGVPRPTRRAAILDDHIPFLQQGVPSIDLIDFDFPCWHRPATT